MQSTGIHQVQTRHLLPLTSHMPETNCLQSRRLFLEEKLQDREIMRREVPDNIDVLLQQSQADPFRIKVIGRPQLIRLDQFPDPPHRAGVEKRVIHHQNHACRTSQVDQLT